MEFHELRFQVCPICAGRVGMDLIGHLTVQHASYFKISFLLLTIVLSSSIYGFTI
jgi:hypothetical protein